MKQRDYKVIWELNNTDCLLLASKKFHNLITGIQLTLFKGRQEHISNSEQMWKFFFLSSP